MNPQFLEAQANDKRDATPFETERDLLRLERQKQQKMLPNPTAENTTPKSSSVIKVGAPLLTPSLEHVENREAVDILAKIYSSLLDNNLVLNPMTELNFVISLITLQHSFGNEKKSSDAKLTIESDESMIDDYENSKRSVNIEIIDKELGCKVLINDDIVSTMERNDLSEFKQFDDSTKSSLLNRKQNNFTDEQNEGANLSEEYFRTIHNCIYFSTKFLNTQRVLLSLLDRATLKLFCENNRIATFLPDLQDHLNKCYKMKLNESSRRNRHFNSFRTTEANVSFQIDTDNRENFPSPVAFQSFRKQRDLFYEALRLWEVHHLGSGWLFSIALGGKIRSLLTLHNDAANYCHFARLFKSQLLLSCIGNGPQVIFLIAYSTKTISVLYQSFRRILWTMIPSAFLDR